MKTTPMLRPLNRVADLIDVKEKGNNITCAPTFEILPVEFLHQKNPFKAYIFLCRFNGKIDEEPYSFRKCYARGCPNNLCAHVSQAILIANRYLLRDYHRLAKAGIQVDEKLFTLEDMMVKFDGWREKHDTTRDLEDYIRMAREGSPVDMKIDLEYVPAVEYFANHKTSQTFLTADFTAITGEEEQTFQRCLSCYQTDREKEEKSMKNEVANARLKELYQIFTGASVKYEASFFQ